MLDRIGGVALAQKSSFDFRFLGELAMQHFDGDAQAVVHVRCGVHDRRRAFTESRVDAVLTNDGAGSPFSHGVRFYSRPGRTKTSSACEQRVDQK
jgi:hypothetical protein